MSGRWTFTPASLGRSLRRLVPTIRGKPNQPPALPARQTLAVRRQLARDVLAREGFTEGLEGLAGRVKAVLHRAVQTPGVVAEGKDWYPSMANGLAGEMAATSGRSIEHAAAVIAHLSPNMVWERNVIAARMAASGASYEETLAALRDYYYTVELPQARAEGRRIPPYGLIRNNWDNAVAALNSDNPLDTFGADAHKTQSFARNIAGDQDAVTLDIWAVRILGYNPDLTLAAPPGNPALAPSASRKAQVYEALSEAYRLAADELFAEGIEVAPAQLQAVTWVQLRNEWNAMSPAERAAVEAELGAPPWLQQTASGWEAISLFTADDLEPLGYFEYRFRQFIAGVNR